MARTGQTRSAAAKAAVTRRRNRERAEAQTAGSKPAASQRHAADQANRVAGDVVKSADSTRPQAGDAVKEAGTAATTTLTALRREGDRVVLDGQAPGRGWRSDVRRLSLANHRDPDAIVALA